MPPVRLKPDPTSLMPDLRSGRCGFEIRLAVASLRGRPGGRARAAPEDPGREHQRFGQHVRVLERQVVEDGIALTPELLDDVHLVGMEVPAAPDPCRVDEADGIEHERIALPASYRVAEVLVRESCVRTV